MVGSPWRSRSSPPARRARSRSRNASSPAIVESPVAVRHLVLRGSNAEIGAHLATLARDRHQVKMVAIPAAERLKPRLLARYHAERFPVHHARMLGRGGGLRPRPRSRRDRPARGLLQPERRAPPGCSVTYYPPATTAGGAGILSRNYDFTTGTLDGRSVPSGPARGHRPPVRARALSRSGPRLARDRRLRPRGRGARRHQ